MMKLQYCDFPLIYTRCLLTIARCFRALLKTVTLEKSMYAPCSAKWQSQEICIYHQTVTEEFVGQWLRPLSHSADLQNITIGTC